MTLLSMAIGRRVDRRLCWAMHTGRIVILRTVTCEFQVRKLSRRFAASNFAGADCHLMLGEYLGGGLDTRVGVRGNKK